MSDAPVTRMTRRRFIAIVSLCVLGMLGLIGVPITLAGMLTVMGVGLTLLGQSLRIRFGRKSA